MRLSRFAASLLIVVGALAGVVIAQTPKPGITPATSSSATTTGTSTATTSSGGVQQTLQEILEEPTSADN